MHLTHPITYFASGASSVSDLRGFARIMHPIGVCAKALSEPALESIEAMAGHPWPIFVDSGAFSEVRVGAGGIEVVAPIDERSWVTILAIQHRIAATMGPMAMVVAPDRVGDQDETLRRLARHADAIRALRAIGASVVVAIQRGPRKQSEFDRAVADTIGFDDFVRGLPSNKDAITIGEVERFCMDVRPAAVHMLGLGPRSSRFNEFVDVFRRLIPNVRMSCDSNLIAANVGKTNGRNGQMRALTAAQHMGAPGSGFEVFEDGQSVIREWSREEAIVLAFGPSMFFNRFVNAMRAEGLVRPDAPRALQLGLFDMTNRS